MVHRTWLAGVVLLASQGCRCSDAPTPASIQSAPAGSSAPAQRCRWGSQRFSLQGEPSDIDPEAAELPFGIEVGRAVFGQQRHWVPFVRGGRSGASAGLLELEESLAGRIIELGELHGDVPPPKVASSGARLVVAMAETDARGGSYRLGKRVGGAVSWFAEADQHGGDSPGFDVLLLPAAGLLAWDDWNAARGNSEIRLAVFDEQRSMGELEHRRVSPESTDAETPRLLPRPGGGAWLVWIALGKPLVQGARNPAAEAPAADELEEPESAVSVHASWLEVLRVDATGQPEGEPLRVTAPDGNVAAYDAIAAHGENLLVAVREDTSVAELDEGAIRVLRVAADGSIEYERLDTPELGASAPSLIFDSAPGGGAPHGWMVLASRAGQTMIGGLTPFGSPLEAVRADPGLGGAGVLAARAGQLLVTNPSGQGATFRTMRCSVADRPSGDAGVRLDPP